MTNVTRYEFHEISQLNKDNVVGCIIARLKSTRLIQKALLPIQDVPMIISLFNRLLFNNINCDLVLATSYLDSDRPLMSLANMNGYDYYSGDPQNMLYRLIDIGIRYDSGTLIRITGDNPLTDPIIIDEMLKLHLDNELDYTRCNNLPFGITAEIFSTEYLYKLCLQIDDLNDSGYLTWFVMLDDNCRKGCLDFKYNNLDLRHYNFSIDYQHEYDNVISLIDTINKPFNEIQLEDILINLKDEYKINFDSIKLPKNKLLNFNEYLNTLDNMNYIIRKTINYL